MLRNIATIGLLVAGVLLVLLGVYYVGKNISGRGAVGGGAGQGAERGVERGVGLLARKLTNGLKLRTPDGARRRERSELEVGEKLIFEFRSFESAEAGLWVKAAVVGTSPHALKRRAWLDPHAKSSFEERDLRFVRLAREGAGVGVGASSKPVLSALSCRSSRRSV